MNEGFRQMRSGYTAEVVKEKTFEFRTGGTAHSVTAANLCQATERFRNDMIAAAHRLSPARFCQEFGITVFVTVQVCL